MNEFVFTALAADAHAYAEALRAIRVLHTSEHYCGMRDGPPSIFTEGEWPGPCPTAVIIDAALSGYGRGGPWPYTDPGPYTDRDPVEDRDA